MKILALDHTASSKNPFIYCGHVGRFVKRARRLLHHWHDMGVCKFGNNSDVQRLRLPQPPDGACACASTRGGA
jgi:hypothetical protein